MTFADAVAALAPTAWYRLGETSGTTAVDASGNGHNATYVGSPALGQPSLVGDTDGSVTFGPGQSLTIPNAAWLSTPAFTWVMAISGWNGTSFYNLAYRNSGYQELWLATSGELRSTVSTVDGGGALYDGNSSAFHTPVGSGTRLVGLSYGASTVTEWLDGVAGITGTAPGSGAMVGDLIVGNVPADPNTTTLTIDEVAIFDRVLTSAEWATLMPFVGSSTPPPPPKSADLRVGGYAYGGASTVSWAPPVASPAPGSPAPDTIRRLHHNPGVPSFEVDTHRPLFADFDAFADVTEAAGFDYIRVTVDGRDVTFFRDGGDEQSRTKVVSWQQLDPYGDGPAELSFPQVTEFDNPGTGDLAWLRPTARVVLNRVKDGAVIDASDPLWVGIITRDGLESGPLSVTCEGNYMARQSRLMHQPYFLHNPARKLKDHLIREHRKIYRADFQIVGDVTGPLLRYRGARPDTRLTYVDAVLGLSNREDGGSYTLMPDRSVARNAMRLKLRTMGAPDYTVWGGAHGVKVSLAREVKTNRVYGEGQNKDGGRWGNRVFPQAGYDDDPPDYPFSGTVAIGETGTGVRILTRRLWSLGLLDQDDAGSDVFDQDVEDAVNEFRENLGLAQTGTVTSSLFASMYRQGYNKQSFQGAHFEPLAAVTETVQWFRGPGGLVTVPNPAYDRGVMPVEEYQADGENVSKREGKKYARATVARQPVRVGTVTLTSDPAECSRYDMRAGTVIDVKNILGTGAAGVPLYVSSVEVDWSGSSVTLGVSTSALHFAELSAIRDRQVEAKQNPSKRARQALRSSAITKDTVQGWESEGPSGVLPYRLAQANQWNPCQVVACEYGTLSEFRAVADTPTQIWTLVFDREVPASLLNHVVGDPSTWRNVLAGYTLSGNTTAGTAAVTCPGATFGDNDLGRTVSGTGIPRGATVSSVNSGTSVDVSPAPTATATGVSLTFGANDDGRKNTFDQHIEFLRKHGLVQAYGSPEEPGGYWPHRHTNDKGKTTDWPVSGVLFDDSPQAFVTTAGFLWVYNWVKTDTRLHGRAKLIPES